MSSEFFNLGNYIFKDLDHFVFEFIQLPEIPEICN